MNILIETNAKEIGACIRKQREALGYSRENLAELTDISNSFLADIERGERGFSVAHLGKLSCVLCMSTDYILFGKEQAADLSFVTDMRSGLDEKYYPQPEELLRVYLKTITITKND